MEPATTVLISIGVLLLVALAVDLVAQRLPLPQVTLLLLVGVLVGPAGLDLLPEARDAWGPVVTDVALVMVGFLIGSDLEWRELRGHGPQILATGTIAALITAAVVAGGLIVVGADPRLALALGGIAAATDPASTLSVIDEERAEGPLTRTLLGIVAIDDALSITLFSVLLAVAALIAGTGGVTGILGEAVREVFGGVLLGAAVGLPAAALTGRLRPGRPTLLEALALVLLTAGLGAFLEVSFLLASIVAGTLVANLARHHDHAFMEVERIDWPFLAVFFILGGASFNLADLRQHAWLVVGYMVLRTFGRVVGGRIGAASVASPPSVRRWLGPSLLPQAGVALGLALLARERFPDIATIVVPVAVVSTVLFELAGPVVTRWGLRRAGESESATADEAD